MQPVKALNKSYSHPNGLIRSCIMVCLLGHCMLQAANYFIAKVQVLPTFAKPALAIGVLIMMITLLA
ncbi:MAG: hypothetical protein WA981_04695 [Glaciecola sp.]